MWGRLGEANLRIEIKVTLLFDSIQFRQSRHEMKAKNINLDMAFEISYLLFHNFTPKMATIHNNACINVSSITTATSSDHIYLCKIAVSYLLKMHFLIFFDIFDIQLVERWEIHR